MLARGCGFARKSERKRSSRWRGEFTSAGDRTACEPRASISGAGAISDVKQGLFLYGGEKRANLQAKTKPKSFDGVRACKFGGGAADACGNGKH